MAHVGQVGADLLLAVSFGGWLACEGCARLIEAGDWPALARRSLRESRIADAVRSGPPGLRVRLLATLTQSQRQFREARAGERRPFEARAEGASDP
jgi:hypothetical protein